MSADPCRCDLEEGYRCERHMREAVDAVINAQAKIGYRKSVEALGALGPVTGSPKCEDSKCPCHDPVQAKGLIKESTLQQVKEAMGLTSQAKEQIDEAAFWRAQTEVAEVLGISPSPVLPPVVQLPSGMIRGETASKVDYSLPLEGPLFDRWAVHLTKGAATHGGKRNWMQAYTQEDYDRFREGAIRHMRQWARGDTDEDHAAAVCFNLNGAEYVKWRMDRDRERRKEARRQVFEGRQDRQKEDNL